jgi:hypothetical protein
VNDWKSDPDRVDPAGTAPSTSATPAQLRDDIDSGRTRDKVAHSDPAAAPLGTDDEAAGTPPTAEQVSMARRQETARDVSDPSAADQPPKQVGMAPRGRFVWLIVAVVVICALVGIALSL